MIFKVVVHFVFIKFLFIDFLCIHRCFFIHFITYRRKGIIGLKFSQVLLPIRSPCTFLFIRNYQTHNTNRKPSNFYRNY